MNNEDKAAWCLLGIEQEHEFLKNQDFKDTFFRLNPKKEENKYANDFRVELPCDLKTIRTPWRKAQKLFNIPSTYAISINTKDVARYERLYPNIIIVLDVLFDDYQAVHFTDLHKIRAIIDAGQAHFHEYSKRKNDKNGNAKSSWIFDVRAFPVLICNTPTKEEADVVKS